MAHYASIRGVLLGNAQSGKTCIFSQLVHKRFHYEYVPTIGINTAFIELEWNDKPIRVQLFDTSGQPRFDSITKSYLNDIAFVFVVCDISEASAMDSLRRWSTMIDDHCTNVNVHKLVLGNKSDLAHAISADTARQYAKKFDMDYREVSAMRPLKLHQTLVQICANVLQDRRLIWNGVQGLKTGPAYPVIEEEDDQNFPTGRVRVCPGKCLCTIQ